MQKKYDVIVCGAGPGGFGAAIGAAKAGKKVLLLDQNSGPGGVAVYCGCPVFSGINSFDTTVHGGVVSEFAGNMRNYAHIVNKKTLNSSEFEVGLVMNRMLRNAGVNTLFYVMLTGATVTNGRITSITVSGCGQNLDLYADAFVDTTGNAILSGLAGVKLINGSEEETMTKTVLFRVSGVKGFNKQLLFEKFPQLDFPYQHQNVFMGTPVCHGEEILLNLTAISGNAMDPFDLTRMDMELREQIVTIVQWAQKKLPGFEKCRITSVAPVIGVRGSRNIAAKKIINACDIDNNAATAEPVALGRRSYGEHYIHAFESPWRKISSGYQMIPYGTLLPENIENLTVGGRCIGIMPAVSSSIRLMPVCMATGQAAGISAALNSTYHESVCYSMLRDEMVKQKMNFSMEQLS